MGGFCGGPAVSANWIERTHLMHHLGQLGFDRIDIDFDEPDHRNGPEPADRTPSSGLDPSQ